MMIEVRSFFRLKSTFDELIDQHLRNHSEEDRRVIKNEWLEAAGLDTITYDDEKITSQPS